MLKRSIRIPMSFREFALRGLNGDSASGHGLSYDFDASLTGVSLCHPRAGYTTYPAANARETRIFSCLTSPYRDSQQLPDRASRLARRQLAGSELTVAEPNRNLNHFGVDQTQLDEHFLQHGEAVTADR